MTKRYQLGIFTANMGKQFRLEKGDLFCISFIIINVRTSEGMIARFWGEGTTIDSERGDF